MTALDACLQKHGITIDGGRSNHGAAEKHVAGAEYLRAFRACNPASATSTKSTLSSPRYRSALVAFAACMRRNGVHLPNPNTTGKGPIFSAKGIDVRSEAFKTASTRCRSILTRAAPHPKPRSG